MFLPSRSLAIEAGERAADFPPASATHPSRRHGEKRSDPGKRAPCAPMLARRRFPHLGRRFHRSARTRPAPPWGASRLSAQWRERAGGRCCSPKSSGRPRRRPADEKTLRSEWRCRTRVARNRCREQALHNRHSRGLVQRSTGRSQNKNRRKPCQVVPEALAEARQPDRARTPDDQTIHRELGARDSAG